MNEWTKTISWQIHSADNLLANDNIDSFLCPSTKRARDDNVDIDREEEDSVLVFTYVTHDSSFSLLSTTNRYNLNMALSLSLAPLDIFAAVAWIGVCFFNSCDVACLRNWARVLAYTHKYIEVEIKTKLTPTQTQRWTANAVVCDAMLLYRQKPSFIKSKMRNCFAQWTVALAYLHSFIITVMFIFFLFSFCLSIVRLCSVYASEKWKFSFRRRLQNRFSFVFCCLLVNHIDVLHSLSSQNIQISYIVYVRRTNTINQTQFHLDVHIVGNCARDTAVRKSFA